MNQSYNYIVVGGGSAGCALANRLSADPSNSVLLLEAGKMDNNLMIRMPGGMLQLFLHSWHQWNTPSIPQPQLGGRNLNMITGKALGGSSSINAMLHIRGTSKDYDRWAEEYGCEGWSYKDVLPYFRATETNKEGGNDQRGDQGELHVMSRDQDLPSEKVIQLFHNAAVECGIPARDDFCDGIAEGVGWTQACIKDGKRHSSARAFIHPVMKERDNLTVLTQALVEKVEFDTTGDEPVATGVTFTHKRKRYTINAKNEVILTAGALRSPQILQVSGIGNKDTLRKAGVECLVDLPAVGENLHDHPTVKIHYDLNDPISMAGVGLLEQAKIGLQWLFQKKGVGSWHHFDANMFIRTKEDLDEADIQVQMIPIIATDVSDGFIDDHGVTFLVCLLAEQSRGSVKINSALMSDSPDFDLGFLKDEKDYDSILRGIDFVRKFSQAEAWQGKLHNERNPTLEVQSEEDLKAFIRQSVETDYHYGGTCCMGNPADKTTVVDPQLKVKGVKNLRVADASVMPVPMHGNTNHACIMIGAKAADLILGK